MSQASAIEDSRYRELGADRELQVIGGHAVLGHDGVKLHAPKRRMRAELPHRVA